MRVLRIGILLLVASASNPALHAATRVSTRRLAPPTPTLHRASMVTHRSSLAHHYFPEFDRPAESLPASVNPPSTTRGFSLVSFAVHSVLGFFSH